MAALNYEVKPTATVLSIEQRRAEYMGNPQVDDGHTRIANELLEAIIGFQFTSRQQTIVLAIIRKTYGYGKKSDRLAQSVISQMTGIAKSHVCKTLKELVLMNVISIDDSNFCHVITLNKSYKEWSSSYQNSNRYQVGSYQNSNELVTKTVTKPLPKQSPQKKERKKENNAFAFCESLVQKGVAEQVAKDFMSNRKLKRLSPTETAFKNICREVEKSGLSFSGAIELCCRKGWGGFEASWVKPEDKFAASSAGDPNELITLPGGRTMTRKAIEWEKKMMGIGQ